MPLALIPTSFEELAIALGVIALGWLLMLLGNLVFGSKREGGKRFIVFLCGCCISALATFICRHFWPALAAHNYPSALAFYVGAAFFTTGIALLWAAVFAANEKVRSWFEAILRGI